MNPGLGAFTLEANNVNSKSSVNNRTGSAQNNSPANNNNSRKGNSNANSSSPPPELTTPRKVGFIPRSDHEFLIERSEWKQGGGLVDYPDEDSDEDEEEEENEDEELTSSPKRPRLTTSS